MPRIAATALTFLLAATTFAQTHSHETHDTLPASGVGEVHFANSGAPEAQADFLRGLALLHNFEYPTAAAAFKAAEAKDTNFAMAYWGEAMTYTHPVWFQQDAAAARAALEKLGKTKEERAAKATTQREKDYLDAVEILYGDGTKEDRDFRYSDAMLALHEKYPDDVDATALAALSLLGTTHHGRDFATYMRAAAMLEEVFPTHLHHPGVLHYLIHCYDDPIHAPLGLRPARLYSDVAPNAGHALHMTSHIFVAIGAWDLVVDRNRRAIDIVNRERAAAGKPAKMCGHYPTWLHYAYLQQRKFDDASAALAACRAEALTEKMAAREYVTMRAHQIASGGPLGDAIPTDDPELQYTIAYADILAGRSDAFSRLAALQPAVTAAIEKRGDKNPSDAIRARVVAAQSHALQLIADGKRNDATALLEANGETGNINAARIRPAGRRKADLRAPRGAVRGRRTRRRREACVRRTTGEDAGTCGGDEAATAVAAPLRR